MTDHQGNPQTDDKVDASLVSEDLIEEVSIDGMCGVY
ncbi:mycofactocin precursor MftA [Nocardioides sp.]|nr:mycofactocin precursor MftA [Nocardioides sp.]MDO9458309.1 mycofactocin precursor MftA [Nocardioides sp.]